MTCIGQTAEGIKRHVTRAGDTSQSVLQWVCHFYIFGRNENKVQQDKMDKLINAKMCVLDDLCDNIMIKKSKSFNFTHVTSVTLEK